MSESNIPVLIVGGGLAGLTTAVMLAWRGIRPLLVERHADTSKHPRARGVNFRSMELLRTAGLEEELRAAGGDAFADFRIVIAESVTGRVLHTILPRGAWDTSALSPARQSAAGQDRVEPILRRRAEALGADIRFATELVSFSQDDGGVTARLGNRRTGAEETVHAGYLVAADGHRGTIRQALGIGAHGRGTIASYMSIVFDADLAAHVDTGGFSLYYLQNPQFTGAFATSDDPRRALVAIEYDPACRSIEDFTEAACIGFVRAALGIPDLAVKIVEVMPWEMSSQLADRFRCGRVFFAGDAAHTMPPTGGLGGQTAIQDGYDLAWKLALIIKGEAGPELLDTYEAERKPVAELTVAAQTAAYAARMRPDREDLAASGPEADYLGVAFGYRYRSPTILSEHPDDGTPTSDPLRPTGTPGTRAPHVLLARDGITGSSLDLIGRDFVLIAGPRGQAWVSAARGLAEATCLPLATYCLGRDIIDVEGAFGVRYGIDEDGATLLRPDGFVAWRSRRRTGDTHAVLGAVLGRVLCRADIATGRGARLTAAE